MRLPTGAEDLPLDLSYDSSRGYVHKAPYKDPIVSGETATIRAIATGTRFPDSETTTSDYELAQVELPVASLGRNVYLKNKRVALSNPTDGAAIYYTLDGSEPTASSNVYIEPIEITGVTSLKVMALKDGYADSGVVETQLHLVDDSIGLDVALAWTSEPELLFLSFLTSEGIIYTLRGSGDLLSWETVCDDIVGDGEERSIVVEAGARSLWFFEVHGESAPSD
ncbi:chitobiase/beta-hexosaminidase C-terminal domain-containing protein [Pelagicoccus sp. SDUM812003]|uniref:chitobiase/beta-hexosaminidase C-terminal domain-containing protein n=1 Tax=Pelagicoccus sp. SDUM812003 TaxID=3041267 RepID=UPI00280CA08B|nr:chitobiase/beta-hexosaminidase C-terminal domain-containing protein [Pelagicoccus sp. SDUM812003]MDQ8201825.1 chitobiase/beta-hexosaminidase C-terminal domain-containing protein [Pelagicoccus sp. SDUM812003]